ncbi:polysaccharide biosynthesis/export family protein [Sphingomonas sp. UYP23]
MAIQKSACLILFAGLAGCASLPSSGPTGKQIVKSAAVAAEGAPIPIIELTNAADVPGAQKVDDAGLEKLRGTVPPPTDLVGPGDVLDINIYEAGVPLFSGGGSSGSSGEGGQPDAGVKVQKLPPTRVSDDGLIFIPYAGKLKVAGRTVSEVESLVRRSLRGLSQNPQVVVSMREMVTNTVIVGGEVARPGRLVLQTNRESLSDVVALAGGYRGSAKDLVLRLIRRNEAIDIRFGTLVANPGLDVFAYPGDKLTLISSPRSYSVMGASGRVDQLPFNQSSISLAQAVASAGGVNPSIGDPAAIFLFRFTRADDGSEKPVVYHLNMMKTGAYFMAQRFVMQDGDVLYFGNASANQPSKVVQLVSQLFSPILTVTSAVQTVQNSRN